MPSPPHPQSRAARLGAGTAVGLALAQLCVGVQSAQAHAHVQAPRPIDQIRAIPEASPALPGESPYDHAKRLLAAADVAGGLTAFRLALLDHPDSADVLDGVAVCYDRLGRPDLAQPYYRAALAIDPSSARLHNNLGYSLYLSKRTEEATAELRLAERSDDERSAASARRTLAEIGEDAARSARAIAASTTSAPAPYVEVVSSAIERTSEGEQRLVIGREPGGAVPAQLQAEATLVAVARPWRAEDDEALIAEADAARPAALVLAANPAVVGRRPASRENDTAILAIRAFDASSEIGSKIAFGDASTLAAPRRSILLLDAAAISTDPAFGGDLFASPRSPSVRAEDRFGPLRDADPAKADPEFDSDDPELNAFATRMRSMRKGRSPRWA